MPAIPVGADALSLCTLLLRAAQHASRDDGPLRVEPVVGASWSIAQSHAAQLVGLELVRVVSHRDLLLVTLSPRSAEALDVATRVGAAARHQLIHAVVSQHTGAASAILRRLAGA